MTTEEELKKALEEKESEIQKLKSIKDEVVTQRDDIKKKFTDAETKISGLEESIVKTVGELDGVKSKSAELAALYTAQVKTAAIRAALEKEEVVAVETAMKLIPLDKIDVDESFSINNDTVTAVVSKLKETDRVLFKQKGSSTVDANEVPKPKRASEGEPKAGFAEELKNCKTASDVEALLRKHGKIN